MSFYTSGDENYFSIDDILATNERIPCRLELPLYKLGFLDSSSESNHLLAGHKIDLPFWLAESLHNRHIISIDLPKVYREAYREILLADANAVDLHKMGPYFYLFGQHLMSFPHRDKVEISKILSKTFRTRFRRIMDSSQNSLNDNSSCLKSNLDRTEEELFNVGKKAMMEFNGWQTRQTERISTSDLVVIHKKRKRTNLESM
ncbi:DNA replication complex GINS protein PSF3-like [Centruroides sculpturatus]|uniref:DNA replication complex GINS protein PSF3-like n=1 Tax=Centruroides sculpturatus TaxID=218467 RepID=UPI000C6D2E90|nr:DNA replication complex GINS protein PSF3-like [Centruroides sculpturatus]